VNRQEYSTYMTASNVHDRQEYSTYMTGRNIQLIEENVLMNLIE
jgi:hypothetical protein